jgi:hypothetical protein
LESGKSSFSTGSNRNYSLLESNKSAISAGIVTNFSLLKSLKLQIPTANKQSSSKNLGNNPIIMAYTCNYAEHPITTASQAIVWNRYAAGLTSRDN